MGPDSTKEDAMSKRFTRCGISLAIAVIFAAAMPATAQSTSFDGFWKVTIITEAGRCDAAYRYPVKIVNGAVVYDTTQGGAVVQISGKVDAKGQVQVVLQRGSQQAVGAGHLSQTAGSGTWTGESQQEGCSGRWEAARTLD
jgi:hypothetical protein